MPSPTAPKGSPDWAIALVDRLVNWIDGRFASPPRIPSFTVANLPDPVDYFNSLVGRGSSALIFVTNETGGSVPAFSDGTNWRRVTDRAIVS